MLRRLFTLLIFTATVSWAVLGQQVFGREHLQNIAAHWANNRELSLAPLAKQVQDNPMHAEIKNTWQEVKQQVWPKLTEKIQQQIKNNVQQRLSQMPVASNSAMQFAQLETQAGAHGGLDLPVCIPTHVFAQRYHLVMYYTQKNQAISNAFRVVSL